MSLSYSLLAILITFAVIFLYKIYALIGSLNKHNDKLSSSVASFIDIYNNNEDMIRRLELNTLLFEENSEAILVLGADSLIHQANKSFQDIYGQEERCLVGTPFSTVFPDSLPLMEMLSSHEKSVRLYGRGYNGSLFPVDTSLTPIFVNGELKNIIATMRDCTAQIEKEIKLNKQVITDRLTGLYNRKGIEGFIDSSIKDGIEFALLFTDLNKFKPVNDTYGHDVGDMYLIDIAEKIERGIGESGVVGRFGGDEFVCLLYGVNSLSEVEERVQLINDEFSAGYDYGEINIPISASFGCSFSDAGRTSRDQLIKKADQAMYDAKKTGSISPIHDLSLDTGDDKDEGVLIDKYALEPMLMPVFSEFNQLEYYEVYLRSPEGGIADIVRQFDERNEMMTIYECIISNLSENNKVLSLMSQGVKFSIKLESSSLYDVKFNGDFVDLMLKYNVPIDRICVRVDEQLLERDFETSSHNLNSLEMQGVSVCLDDFCQGHLSVLERLSLAATVVKLPREVVDDIYNNKSKLHMLNSIFGLVNAMQSSVVVEGVKSKEMLDLFIDHGVDFVLGEFFGEPIPLSSI